MVPWVNFIVYKCNIFTKITVTGLPRLFLIKILSNVFHLVHWAHKIFRKELRVQGASLVLRTVGNSVCRIEWWPFLGVYTLFSKELLENPKHKQTNKVHVSWREGRFLYLPCSDSLGHCHPLCGDGPCPYLR